MRLTKFSVACLAVAACGPGDGTNAKLATQEDSVGYIMGYGVGANMRRQNAPQPSLAMLRGLTEGYKGGEPSISDSGAQAVMTAFQTKGMETARRNDSIASTGNASLAATFFPENAKKTGVQTSKTGLQWKILKEGTGPRPKPTSVVKVHYKGSLLSGEGFDSSYVRGPIEFSLNEVIPGWTEGVGLMNTGAKYQFWIPSALAYGPTGRAPVIGPNAALTFEVELLSFR